MDVQEELDHQSDNRPFEAEEIKNVATCSSENRAVSDSEELTQPYEKKYLSLLKKCQSIQQGNDRLVNRVHRVKRLLKQLRKEKRFLMMRLDQHGDEYKKVPLASSDLQFSKESASPENVTNKRPHPTSSTTTTPAKSASQSSKSHQSGSSGSSKKKSSINSKHQKCGSASQTKHIEKDEKPNTTTQQPPKWPENPFFLFCQEQRSIILDSKHHQDTKNEVSHEEVTRILAKKWSCLPFQEKKVYYEAYERQKSLYDQELKAISASNAARSSGNVTFNPDIVIKEEMTDSST